MSTKISLTSYGDYSTSNYGAHCLSLTVGNLELYFSYKTVIAFRTPKTGLKVIQNQWSTTTGKHLNMIDGNNKKQRLTQEEFNEQLTQVLKDHKLDV